MKFNTEKTLNYRITPMLMHLSMILLDPTKTIGSKRGLEVLRTKVLFFHNIVQSLESRTLSKDLKCVILRRLNAQKLAKKTSLGEISNPYFSWFLEV